MVLTSGDSLRCRGFPLYEKRLSARTIKLRHLSVSGWFTPPYGDQQQRLMV